MSEPKKCEALGCEESAAIGRTLCHTHHGAHIRGVDVRATLYKRQRAASRVSSSGICAALGCTEPRTKSSLCFVHIGAKNNGIDVYRVEYRRRNRPGAKVYKRKSDGSCAVEGCTKARSGNRGCTTCVAHSKYHGWNAHIYDAVALLQQNKCAVCSIAMKKPQRDHCHTTGQPRGLLCQGCNTHLGHYEKFRPLATPPDNDTPDQRAACEPFERYLRNTPVMQLEALREPEAAE